MIARQARVEPFPGAGLFFCHSSSSRSAPGLLQRRASIRAVNANTHGHIRCPARPQKPAKAVEASSTDYLSNISPQKKDLNEGPWKALEDKVRDVVRSGNVVWVMTGPVFDPGVMMPPLPQADEPHTVPTGYWKIVTMEDSGELKVTAFIMGQDAAKNADLSSFLVSVDDVEAASGLDFFWELPDSEEQQIETGVTGQWLLQR